MAPGIDPIPPNTAATNALIPGMAPVYGVRVGYAEQSRRPAIAASPEPIAKGKGNGCVYIDTHQLCSVAVLRDSLHGTSWFGFLYEKLKADHNYDTYKDSYDGNTFDR